MIDAPLDDDAVGDDAGYAKATAKAAPTRSAATAADARTVRRLDLVSGKDADELLVVLEFCSWVAVGTSIVTMFIIILVE